MIREFAKEGGFKTEEEARTRFEDALKKEGFTLEAGGGPTLKIAGQLKDAKAKVYNKTADLVKRTNQLYSHYN